MTDTDCTRLYEICQRWAARIRPDVVPADIPVRRLPKPTYDGDNPYNGFTGAERRRGEQVLQVLRREGIIEKPAACDICGKTERIGYHGEDYYDPFSMARLCFPCHMALHRRFKSPDKWQALLERNGASPYIDEFHALPMQEVDFAAWLRVNTPGPHDVVRRVWPDREVPDYQSRQVARYKRAIEAAQPTETEWKLLQVLRDNPGATSEALSAAMGWQGQAWHLQFGRFCRRLEGDLGPAPLTDMRKDDAGKPARFYTGLLAEFDADTRGFTLRSEAVRALDLLGLCVPGDEETRALLLHVQVRR